MKPCPSYPGYSADEAGNIYSHFTYVSPFGIRPWIKRKMKGTVGTWGGYQVYHIKIAGKKHKVFGHWMVLDAFHGPKPFPKAVCRHLDGNGRNNSSSNLKWGTYLENGQDRVRHGTSVPSESNRKCKLTGLQVLEIRSR